MKIFITGISGFLGSHVAETLQQQGHEIFALVRKTSKLNHVNFHFHPIESELPYTENLSTVLAQVDAVIHIAGKVKALSQKEFEETNALGSYNLAQTCLKANPKPKIFIYVSTIAVLNPSLDGNDFCIPPDKCHPLSWYGQSKLNGEKALQCLKDKMRVIILRPPVLYGPRDEELFPLFKAIKRGFAPLYGDGSNQLSLCYVKDVADCIAGFIASPPPQDEIYCLDDGILHTWKSLATTISKSLNKKIYTLPIPSFLFPIGAFFTQLYAKLTSKAQIFTLNKLKEMKQTSWLCGYEKLAKERGWKPKISLEQGAQLTYQFYQENKWL